jgi:ribose/xylose/arabinose/galactoside ABC-type transport system permease subunit
MASRRLIFFFFLCGVRAGIACICLLVRWRTRSHTLARELKI